MARTRPLPELDTLAWSDFLDSLRWTQGQHVSLIGPTNAGKTTLALELMAWRARQSSSWHQAVLATKPRDRVLDRLVRRGDWEPIPGWPPPWNARQVIVWPRWRGRHDTPNQRVEIRGALDAMFGSGHWAVLVDEASYLCRRLGLESDLRDWWQQGRSLGCSLVASTQRPAWVPLDIYSAPTHLFLWRTNDAADLKRLAGLGGLDTEPIRRTVAQLPLHRVLYVNTDTGRMTVTLADRSITA